MMQSIRDDMSGNWNGDIFDMDDGKKKKNGQLNFSLIHKTKEEKKSELASACH